MKRTAVQTPLLALMLSAAFACGVASSALAQYAPPQYSPSQYAPPPAPIFQQQDLDRMLAPIALYPDALLSQILMASTYPLEVQEAARWSRSNPGFAGDQAVQLAAQSGWDPSVQSLTAFPQVLAMMDENIQWTESLGEAFLAQQSYVMDTVQSLRQRAWAAGTLSSNGYMVARQQGPLILIDSAQPQVVYVPYYDPLLVYGTWWYPAYPPVRWRAWPGYARSRASGGFYWGPAISVSAGVFFGRFDWQRRNVTVVRDYAPRGNERFASAPRAWVHAPEHRRGEPYRHEEVRRQVTAAPAQQHGQWDRAQHQQGPWDKAQGQQGTWDRAQQQQLAPAAQPRWRDGRPEARSEPARSLARVEQRPEPPRAMARVEQRHEAPRPAAAQHEPSASLGSMRPAQPMPPQMRAEPPRAIARVEERHEAPRPARLQAAASAPAVASHPAEPHQENRGHANAGEQHGRGPGGEHR